MRKEIWRPVVGFEGLYEVSDWGRVKSLARVKRCKGGSWQKVAERILGQHKNRGGYIQVVLCKDGKTYCKRVHRLVWEAFNYKIPEAFEINHIDENKENNTLWNLNLMTRKDNANWGTRTQRQAKALSKPIVAKNDAGEVVYEFLSIHEAEKNGFGSGAVCRCCNGCFHREGNHKYKGLNWYYK